MDIQKHTHGALTYYLSDHQPSVLFLSGMHGDEYESGKLLEKILVGKGHAFPSFLYIPQVSPSAVISAARNNTFCHDINRQFLPTTEDPEALTVMKILKPHTFKLVIDIHEDPDRTKSFYLYDTNRMSEAELDTYRGLIHHTNARLYTGTDDIEDENLGCHIEKGYYSFRPENVPIESGFLSIWMTSEGIAKRVFTLEIPGKADQQLKYSIIETVIPFLTTSFGV